MNQILILITALLFFYIGKYSHTKAEQEIITKAIRKIKKRPKAGVIPFKTPEDFEDERSGDKALERQWRESGFADRIKQDEN